MSDKQMTKAEWKAAKARIYHFGHFMLLLIQLLSVLGMAFCGLLILMMILRPMPDTETIITVTVSTVAAVSIWRGTTKMLNAVGKHGRDYYYDPFRDGDWSE
ncbi:MULTISPECIES: hypothetical protein [unclassified Sphingopyxis]|uniref:hypothetical protein n=1 Tax=unclassified Sphingopyxis TaxID=2614943 RepID=UPI00073077AF|nr:MULTISPECIES: hypothetical protein [unclassified Sphingopyxis]KTE19891.1 hypothetical protein ATE61_20215 [Sphingopyxis sp. H057]KTE48878.1 hypothetical protein ATE64_20165 [Sphingopyxis sp. H073]KTE53311.1 hypothetical protein ATE69_13435 [Sphingopyxis sp. H071]KTE55335.1 hypothetical protein ATE66_19790 [Sphingopyxis sp. H107]KTE60208.1 hypothetical protein ATE65_19525 [Sphingopyxis sp. H100]